MKKILASIVVISLFTACTNATESTSGSDTSVTTVDTSSNPPAPGTVDTSRLADDTAGAKRAIRK